MLAAVTLFLQKENNKDSFQVACEAGREKACSSSYADLSGDASIIL